jgi:YgiT-type zinc finger domain-containing protein
LTGRIVERQMDRVTGETCDLCGRPGARTRRTTRMFGSGASIVVIEGIPIVRCASCGEGYLTATTLKVIDRIRKQRRKLGRRSVAVAKFEGAA